VEQPQNPAPKAMLASLNQDIQDEFDQTETNVTETHESDLSQINSLHAYRDVSKPFRDTLKTRKEKLITFFLSKHDQYIKLPPRESEID
jgi:Mg2+ and Co2+ transporter CorA